MESPGCHGIRAGTSLIMPRSIGAMNTMARTRSPWVGNTDIGRVFFNNFTKSVFRFATRMVSRVTTGVVSGTIGTVAKATKAMPGTEEATEAMPGTEEATEAMPGTEEATDKALPPSIGTQQTESLAGLYRCFIVILLNKVSNILHRWDEGSSRT